MGTARDEARVEHERLLEAERSATRRATTLAAINETLLSAVGPEDVLARLVGDVSIVAGADMCLVIEVTGDVYTVTHVRGVDAAPVGQSRDAAYYPAFALAARSREPVLIGDTWSDPRTNKDFVRPNRLRAFQLLPLVVYGEVTAILALAYAEPQAFDAADAEFCERVSVAMSLALRNARTLEAEAEARRQAKRELERTQLLQEVTSAATSTLSLEEIGERVLALIRQRLGARMAAVYAIDEVRNELRALTLMGYPEDIVAAIQRVPIDETTSAGRLATLGLPLITNDSEPIPPASAVRLERMGADSLRWVVVAISSGEHALGVMALLFEGMRPFADDELSLYRSVAELLGAAFENARLFESVDLRASRLQALQGVSGLLSSSLEMSEVINRGLDEVIRLFDVVATSLWLVGSDGGRLRLSGHRGFPQEFSDDFRDGLEPDAPYDVARAFRLGEPIVHPDACASSVPQPVRDAYARYGVPLGSLVALPLRSRSGPIGGITLAWGTPRPTDAGDVEFESSLADTMAGAIENARAFEAVQAARNAEARLAERTQILRELADIGATSQTASDAGGRQAAMLMSRLALKTATIFGLGIEQRVLVPIAAAGYAPDYIEEHFGPVDIEGEGLSARVFRSGDPVFVRDVETDETLSEAAREFNVALGLRSGASLPLVNSGTAVGVLSMSWAEPGMVDTWEPIFLESVASQIALGLEAARLYETTNRQAVLSRVLAETGALLAASLDIAAVMDDVIAAAARVLGADGGWLVLRESGGWRRGAGVGLRADQLEEYRSDGVAVSLAQVLQMRAPLFVSDVRTAPHVDRELAERVGYRSFILYPVEHRDTVTGAVGFYFEHPRQRIEPDELEFLARLAFMIGVAEENSRLYRAEHRIAEKLQEALLAMPESVAGVDFAHSYRSATETERVGGDFYDVFELSNGHVGITIGDVAGKGIDAAVLTSLVKNTIRAHATERGKTPSEILALTDDVVYRATPTESFVTVFFGLLDCRDGHLTYANAGHTTAALLRADGTVAGLRANGPILGAFANARFGESETRLEGGDTLLLYTDGLTETRRDRQLYGEGRLFDLLASLAGRPISDIVSAVTGDVFEFGGHVLRDDIAVLAVTRTDAGPEAPGQLKFAL